MRNKNNLVTVITPTYNRSQTLNRLYESLLKQSNKNFKWLIVDDGSTDDTKKVVNKFIEEDLIVIKYLYKKNGGKHTALNFGIKEIETDLTFIVDSDDFLIFDAIERIYYEWEKVKHMNLCGISFLRGYSQSEVIGNLYPKDYVIDNFINLIANKNVVGDKAEVWVTKLLKANPFPEFEGEKFIGESVVWYKLGKKYNMLFINKIIYICEYIEGGLTKSGRKIRINAPLGRMEISKITFNNQFSLETRIKNMWLYICYGFFAKKSINYMMKDSGIPLLAMLNIPFGFMIYVYWNLKYNKLGFIKGRSK